MDSTQTRTHGHCANAEDPTRGLVCPPFAKTGRKGGPPANSDFSGPFNNVSGAAPEGPGGSVSWASNGVKIVQGGAGVSLIPTTTGTYSYTWTSKPKQAGNIWTNLPSPLGLFDFTIYALRKAGGC